VDATGISFSVLGPVRAWHDGAELDVGSPQQRAVLAALLLSEGTHLTPERLVDGVWGQAAPRTAQATIRTYIYRLRRAFPTGTDNPITLLSGGYALTPAGSTVDLTVFRTLLAQARAARAEGDHSSALTRLDDGLALWRGTALAGVPGPYAQAQRTPLEELRLTAIGERLATAVDLGQHVEVATELAQLVAEHPLVERFRELLMIALYRAGRQADALAVFTETRHLLREELGVDPAPPLQEVYRRILAADPDLARPAAAPVHAPAPPPPPAAPTRVVISPAQLPADLPDFVGRADELDLLTGLAAEPSERPAPIVVIGGMAGIGKTTLAVHAAHRLTSGFPDGQLYVNLRGFDPDGRALDPAGALAGFLQALGVPARELPGELDERAALYRSRLVHRRVLVLLDNARDAAQVRPLLPGASGCLTIITSRNQLPGLAATHGAHPIRLPLFDRRHAKEFLSRRLGRSAAGSPRALDEIIERCGRLPLALAVVAARAAQDECFPLDEIAEDLGTAHGSLDAFAGEDPATNTRVVFSWSYQALEPEAARLFRLLSLHPRPDVTAPAAASLLALPVSRTRQLLAGLARAHLVTVDSPGRHACHDLLSTYADELARATDSPAELEQALHRLLEHYLHTAAAASRLYSANRVPLELPEPRPGVSRTELTTAEQASEWFTAQHPILVELVTRTAAGGRFDPHVWQLTWAMSQFLHGRGLWHELVALSRTAMVAAVRLGDPIAQANIHAGLARANANLGRLDEASSHMRQALDLFIPTADATTVAEHHRMFSWVLEQQGRYDVALRQAEQALRLHRSTGDPARRATALNAVGWCHALLGQYEQALTYCREALALLEQLGEQYGQADTWDSLGFAHHHLGQYPDAVHAYQRALTLSRGLGVRYPEADTLVRLGDTHLAAGDRQAADIVWRQALAILVELDHANAESVRDRLAMAQAVRE